MKAVVSFKTVGLVVYMGFLIFSFLAGFEPGKEMAGNLLDFLMNMLKILPFAFVLIGLFEVWVKKETVERHLGVDSGLRGYLWAILLAGLTVGGIYVAFPVAHSLYSKGAKLGVIFTYVGASAICRIPMTIYEASFMGIKFTAIRFLVSLPLLVLSSMALGAYLERRNYGMGFAKDNI
ncbi:MAG: hypothetical protein PWR00_1530 [Thermovirga sp.]|jgi:uncharacterized membrane protein YraQ (UPF0718 family)|nr:hypothetical protein [Thermovirga sp.]